MMPADNECPGRMMQMLVEARFRSNPRMARPVVFWQRCRGCVFYSRLRRHVAMPIDENRRGFHSLLDGDGPARWLGGAGGKSEVRWAGAGMAIDEWACARSDFVPRF